MVSTIYGPDLSDFMTSGRVVLDRREGNKVFLRTLRYGENETGEGVNIKAGEQVIFDVGALSIDTRQIDSKSDPERGGYSPVANTIWTWYIITGEELGYFCYIFALARRLDATHAEWASAIEELEKSRENTPAQRHRFFRALSLAEVTIISLSRVLDMLETVEQLYSVGFVIPDNLQLLAKVIRDMRNAFEHIDARAQGIINASGKMDDEAYSIFIQPEFLGSSMIYYRGNGLNFHDDVLSACLACRKLLLEIVELRVQRRKTEMPNELQ